MTKKKVSIKIVAKKPRRARRAKAAAGVVRGKGGYWGAAIGRWLGNKFGLGDAGEHLGDKAGDRLGDAFKRVTGIGDYQGAGSGSGVPFMHSPDNSVRYCNHEYITDVTSAVTFTATTFEVNPGLSSFAPHLSQIAVGFQKYRMHGLAFYYKSTSADALNSTNVALGTVVLASNYDPNAAVFANKQSMEATKMCASGPPSSNLFHGIECDVNQGARKTYNIRNGTLPTGAVQADYDICNTVYASVGCQAASVVGELWVMYDVEFFDPILSGGAAGLDQQAAHLSWAVGASTSAYFGTGTTQRGLLPITYSGTVITFPVGFAGNILMCYTQNGAGTAVTQPTITGSAGVADLGLFSAYGVNYSTNTGTTTSNLMVTKAYTVSVVGLTQQTLTFSVGTLPTTPTYGDLIIIEYPHVSVGEERLVGRDAMKKRLEGVLARNDINAELALIREVVALERDLCELEEYKRDTGAAEERLRKLRDQISAFARPSDEGKFDDVDAIEIAREDLSNRSVSSVVTRNRFFR